MNKILIIEDQPQMRKNLATILEMEGFKVVSAENGRRGVELARAENPDLVICDVMMPDLDGYGVLQALRAETATATVPFVFLTAKGDKTDLRAGMNLGADDYLTKPVSRADLLGTVKARLARRSAHVNEVELAASAGGFNPDFSSSKPLEGLGLTQREAEVLLWVGQGKSNGDIALLLGMAEKTVKKHMGNIFDKLGLEGAQRRNRARAGSTERAKETVASQGRSADVAA
jgi:DNA-binding NarL/FixJ family response regulator